MFTGLLVDPKIITDLLFAGPPKSPLTPSLSVSVIAVALLVAYEHSLVRAHDLSRLNAAFFTMNGVISIVFFFFVAADLIFSH